MKPMSLKATIAYGRNSHFFHESYENNFVYSEMEDVPYEVSYRRVMVAPPINGHLVSLIVSRSVRCAYHA